MLIFQALSPRLPRRFLPGHTLWEGSQGPSAEPPGQGSFFPSLPLALGKVRPLQAAETPMSPPYTRPLSGPGTEHGRA